MKHTSGPWKTDDSEFPAVGSVLDTNDEQICQTSERKEYAPDRSKQVEIRNANARLIAASPDLLEALKEYVEGYEGSRAEREARAKAAIAKAEGNV